MSKKSTTHLIVGTIERGSDKEVLNVLSLVSEYFKTKNIYTGSLATYTEMSMYSFRTRALAKTLKILGKEEESEKIKEQINTLVQGQDSRIEELRSYFKNIKFVTNDELFIDAGQVKKINYTTHLDLTDDLTVSPVAPNGDRISGNPISNRSIQMYRYFKNSVICPHPIVASKIFAKEGINNNYQFITTGALRFLKNAKKQSQTFEHFSHPGAILVSIKDDEFFIDRLFVDKTKDGQYFCLFDGLLFTDNEVYELNPENNLGFITDSHGSYKNQAVWDAFKKSMLLHISDTVVHGGDLADMSSLNHHIPFQNIAHENLRLKDELELFRDDIQDLYFNSPNKLSKNFSFVVLESNHHNWFDRFIDNNKFLKGLIGFEIIESELKLLGCNVDIRKDKIQKSYSFGDMIIRHGHKDKSLMELSKSYDKAINGHFHTEEQFMNAARVPCSCDYPGQYMAGVVDKWVWGFVLMSKHQGITRPFIKTVKNGKFSYRCKVY